MHSKRLQGLGVALAISALAVTAGCSAAGGGSGGGSSGGGSVAYVPGTAGVAFYEIMNDEGKKTADKLGLHFTYQGAGDWSPTLQTPIVDGICTNKPDVLIITATDGKAMAAALQRCINDGVKLISVDTLTDPSTKIQSSITADNAQGGALAADYIAKQIGEQGKVAVIGGQATASTNTEREQGFTNEIKKKYPQIQQVQTQWTESQDPAKAQSLVSDLLVAQPDIKGVFCVIEHVAEGCGAAVANSGLRVQVVAYDASESLVSLMRKGTIDALIAQPAREEIKLAVQDAAAVIKGKPVKKTTKLANILITKAQVDDPGVQKYYYMLK